MAAERCAVWCVPTTQLHCRLNSLTTEHLHSYSQCRLPHDRDLGTYRRLRTGIVVFAQGAETPDSVRC